MSLCVYLHTYFSTIQFGKHVFAEQQDAETVVKKLDKAKANLQAALDANIALKGELHIARGVMERQNTENEEGFF